MSRDEALRIGLKGVGGAGKGSGLPVAKTNERSWRGGASPPTHQQELAVRLCLSLQSPDWAKTRLMLRRIRLRLKQPPSLLCLPEDGKKHSARMRTEKPQSVNTQVHNRYQKKLILFLKS
ncbi:hypothetical protein NDU88_000787 [Pleurodeles waltl]|uniref:Uncharacterized protein n=1 Tax=Pleurodeles waltl TaxID=8319 RepID=A0AAV7R5Y4_PLEWA|nr:hypothetical protein NDU88_000787 [Pleurodeles waltl]